MIKENNHEYNFFYRKGMTKWTWHLWYLGNEPLSLNQTKLIYFDATNSRRNQLYTYLAGGTNIKLLHVIQAKV